MTITVKLFALFRQLYPEHHNGIIIFEEYPQKVGNLIAQLNLPPDKPKIIFINGRLINPNTVLKSGDVVSIFSYISGG